MTDPSQPIVIVDGYSTGRDLVRALLERDAECLHLRSTPALPSAVAGSFDPSPYDAELGYLGDAGAASDALKAFQPRSVIAGSEWGVTFAEQVAARLGLATNRPELSNARRDKFAMIETARACGLHVAQQSVVTSPAAAHAWASRHATWPVVVKPLASAGADGVTLCRSHADIDSAFAAAIDRENFMGGFNDSLLMQSYLAGPQFIVNTVSRNGRHYVTDVWSMSLVCKGNQVIPGGIDLLDPGTSDSNALIAYTTRVLDALGIENGAAHTELRWTPEGPALIETGARIMGAAMDEASYRAAGTYSQASVYATVLSGEPWEYSRLFAHGHYEPGRHMSKLMFDFTCDGQVTSVDGLSQLRSLPSFHAHYRGLKPGDLVCKTKDWLCRGGVVYLVHDSREQISADIATFRDWERRGRLYGIESVIAAEVV